MFFRTRHLPLRVTPPKIAIILSESGFCPVVSIVKRLVDCGAATAVGVPMTTRSRVIGIRSSNVLAAINWSIRSSLLAGQPAFGVRRAEQGGYVLAVGVGSAQVATGNGANVRRFGSGLGHHPKLVRSSKGGGGTPFRAGSGAFRGFPDQGGSVG